MPALGPAQFMFLQDAFAASSAITAAQQLGVLARLQAGPVVPSTLARDCGLGERGARLLLSALAGLGLAEANEDGSFRAVANLSRLSWFTSLWAHLREAIQTDRPFVMMDTPGGAQDIYPDVVAYLGEVMRPMAERAADHLAAPGLRVLDVGAGAAPWSLALATRDPTCRVMAIDLPAVLDITRQAVTAAGCQGQFELVGGDLFTMDWGNAAYDLAIAGNVCHLFNEAANQSLLARLLAALQPGGKLAILDAIPTDQLDGPRPVVLYSLGLLLRTCHGQAYPFSAYQAWLRASGYQRIERTDWPDCSISLITAYRPDLQPSASVDRGRAT